MFEFDVANVAGQITIVLSMATWLGVALIILFLAVAAAVRYGTVFRHSHPTLSEIELNLPGGKAKFSIERNYQNLEIAHRILIELITRKAAIPIEEGKDVIAEVYDSWYALFCTTRDEIKKIGGVSLKDPTSESLIEMATDVLNKGLRPHLTEYQARFRRWYDEALTEEANGPLSPQEIQLKFPGYDDLISSMRGVNHLLIEYAGALKKFIYS